MTSERRPADPSALRRSYALIAPLYDLVADRALRRSRARSLAALRPAPGAWFLVPGAGTGLDLAFLHRETTAVCVDFTTAMLLRARERSRRFGRADTFVLADAQRLPFRKGSLDGAVLHLVLAVVPDPGAALAEAARVVVPGARLAVLDKFVRAGERPGHGRRLLDRLLRNLATGLLLSFEEALAAAPSLSVSLDEPDLLGGAYRRILLVKEMPE
jgi:ubiquinone/menaquinone biosynthesis C-methylase UbiE